MTDIVDFKPVGSRVYLQIEDDVLQIGRLTAAIRFLACCETEPPGDAYFGIALAIEEHVAAIKRHFGTA